MNLLEDGVYTQKLGFSCKKFIYVPCQAKNRTSCTDFYHLAAFLNQDL